MIRTQLPNPPAPMDYRDDPAGWQDAVYQWMSDAKIKIEADSSRNVAPIGPFVVSTYTAVATVTGTDALSNFVATLVTAMNDKGITAPFASRR